MREIMAKRGVLLSAHFASELCVRRWCKAHTEKTTTNRSEPKQTPQTLIINNGKFTAWKVKADDESELEGVWKG